MDTEDVRFDEIFPSVRRLKLDSMVSTDPSFLEHNFTYLEHLELNMLRIRDNSKLARMLELNSHIRSISIYQCSLNLLAMINEKLTRLESPEVSHVDVFSIYRGEDIHFKHLKRFTLKYGVEVNERIPLMMTNLEEFKYPGSIDRWFEIIMQNKHMKKLTIDNLNNVQLMRIVNELEELEEITMSYQSENSANDVVRFIETGKHLKKIVFHEVNFDIEQITQQIGLEWKITNKVNEYTLLKEL